MTDMSLSPDAVAPPRLELTPLERVAMSTDLHAIACEIPLGQCVECMTLLHSVRRILKLVTPRIKEVADGEADDFYVEDLCRFIYDHADTDEAVMHAEQFSVNELAEVAERWQPGAWERYLLAHEPADGIDSDEPPVAAASNPTRPEGE